MTRVNKDYLYTEEWDDLENVSLEDNSLYFYAHDPEERSFLCAKKVMAKNPQTIFEQILYNGENDYISILGQNISVSLNSYSQISEILSPYKDGVVYIEVTGLSCRVAAPLMKYAMENNIEMRIVYAEPLAYRLEEFSKMGVQKDLSELVSGIEPLPGMTNLLPHRKSPLFVVLLGFEGGRFSQIVQDQNPDDDKITPVLGVPGYRPNYPYISMWGNRYQIKDTNSWQRLQYAEANSIVDIYMLLNELSYGNRDSDMIIAPIGTKPHAIGAILYAIKHPDKVEIVYDNPIRKVHRTEGIGKVLMCNITKLFNEN